MNQENSNTRGAAARVLVSKTNLQVCCAVAGGCHGAQGDG